MKRQFRIHTILALALLVAGLGGLVKLVDYGEKVIGKANPSIVPQKVRITNVTDTKATISWLTSIPVTGRVIMSKNGKKQIFRDDREQTGPEVISATHYVSVNNLSPMTTYYFYILSNDKQFDDQGKAYTLTTGTSLLSPPSSVDPAYGKVVTENDQPAEGAIIYLTVGGSASFSTLVKSSGSWLIAINTARTPDGKSYYIPSEGEQEAILIRLDMDRETQAITDIEHDSPVPTMVIGKKYNFELKNEDKQPLAENLKDGNVLGNKQEIEPTRMPTYKLKKDQVNILVPKENGALATTKPLFRGTGIPGKTVIITVESNNPQTGEAIVSDDGSWYWSPPENLLPGKHKLTIKTLNDKGNVVIKTHTFTVFKSGTQVLGEATPSATLTPTVSLRPTIAPTVVATTTPALTNTPTATDSGKGGLPTSGHYEATVILFGLGMMMIFFGFLRFLKPIY